MNFESAVERKPDNIPRADKERVYHELLTLFTAAEEHLSNSLLPKIDAGTVTDGDFFHAKLALATELYQRMHDILNIDAEMKEEAISRGIGM